MHHVISVILTVGQFHKNADDTSIPFLTAFQAKGSHTEIDLWLSTYFLALKRNIWYGSHVYYLLLLLALWTQDSEGGVHLAAKKNLKQFQNAEHIP